MSEKTEEPTARRLARARKEGDSPVSAVLTQAFVFLVALALAPSAIAALTFEVGAWLKSAVSLQSTDVSSAKLGLAVLVLSAPIVASGALAAAIAGLVQSGGVLAMGSVAPKLERLNPAEGVKNLFTLPRMFSIVRALIGALVVFYLAGRLILDHAAALANSAGNLGAALALSGDLIHRLAWLAALLGLSLAVLDLLATRFSWKNKLKMSMSEVRQEYREAEGDPDIKAARKRAHQELLASATIAAVREATVLIVNPTHLATALHYTAEDDDQAPRVVSQGRGELARLMMDAARAYGVPIVRDVPVARALMELEVGDEIPEALYEAVAEILRELWETSEGGG